MARQLKVFSTPAGFVNAVVAAPSQKAALEAWGLRENVFANGTATVVTDPELIARALATPGEIVRVLVGDADAILKGLKPTPRAAKAAGVSKAPAKKAEKAKPEPTPPPPDRGPLIAAEKALSSAESHRRDELRGLDDELQALKRRRGEREVELDRAISDAAAARDEAARLYRQAGGEI